MVVTTDLVFVCVLVQITRKGRGCVRCFDSFCWFQWEFIIVMLCGGFVETQKDLFVILYFAVEWVGSGGSFESVAAFLSLEVVAVLWLGHGC